MRTARRLIVGLVAILMLTGIAVTSASAQDKAYWIVLKGGQRAKLEATESVKKVITDFGASTIGLVKNGQTIDLSCTKTTGEEEIKGGLPGTDIYENFAWFGCSVSNKAMVGCELKGGVNTENFGAGNWLTKLEIIGGTTFDIGEKIKFKMEFEKCTVGANNNVPIVIDDPMRQIKTDATNRTGFVHVVFKPEAEEGFEVEGGGEFTLESEGEMKIEGGVLEIGETC
jgi:hypothetical protein